MCFVLMFGYFSLEKFDSMKMGQYPTACCDDPIR